MSELTPDHVDQVVVERCLAGQRTGRELTTAEQVQVIVAWRAKAFTDNRDRAAPRLPTVTDRAAHARPESAT
jgi:hypothetical protein